MRYVPTIDDLRPWVWRKVGTAIAAGGLSPLGEVIVLEAFVRLLHALLRRGYGGPYAPVLEPA